MQFNSIEFLFGFLPAYILIYILVPRQYKSVAMVLGSLLYYALVSNGNYWWLGILLGVTMAGYLAGLSLRRGQHSKLLCFYLIGFGGILVFFKIYEHGRFLPPGMSFYLFQIAAYLIDVHRNKCTTEDNLLSFTGQIVLFPKLLSGPLMNPTQLQQQNSHIAVNAAGLRRGLQLLILGLGFKVLLANRLGGLWAEAGIAGYAYISVPFAWLALIAYALQLYFDFYGYSLMAMGLGKMLGYDLPRNFDSPYASKTVSEFYRRWHITLGMWFREYLYIPLGGNRKGIFRTIVNLAVVWLFTGLWHGTDGNYLLWASFLFILIVNERLWLGKLMRCTTILCHIYVVFVILLSWIPFAVGDFGEMLALTGRLFGISGITMNSRDIIITGSDYIGMILAGGIFATPMPRRLWEKIHDTIFADIVILALFWFVVYYISTAAQDPFMYFQY